MGCKPLVEGIIFGVSGALMLKIDKAVKGTFIFAETHSNLPDSRASAKIIEMLNKYLVLGVDYKPLLQRASEFEEKLKGLVQKTQEATMLKRTKEPDTEYIG